VPRGIEVGERSVVALAATAVELLRRENMPEKDVVLHAGEGLLPGLGDEEIICPSCSPLTDVGKLAENPSVEKSPKRE